MFNNKEIFKYILLGILVYLFTNYLPLNIFGNYEKYRSIIIVISSIIIILFTSKKIENFNSYNILEKMTEHNIEQPEIINNVEPVESNIVNTEDVTILKKELEDTRQELLNIRKIKHNPENTRKYYNLLKIELFNKGMIDQEDVDLYDDKINSGEPIQNIIVIFENLKQNGTSKKIESNKKKIDISKDNWEESQQFHIIHSDFWSLPHQREPVCQGPTCKTCSFDNGLDGFPIGKPIN